MPRKRGGPLSTRTLIVGPSVLRLADSIRAGIMPRCCSTIPRKSERVNAAVVRGHATLLRLIGPHSGRGLTRFQEARSGKSSTNEALRLVGTYNPESGTELRNETDSETTENSDSKWLVAPAESPHVRRSVVDDPDEKALDPDGGGWRGRDGRNRVPRRAETLAVTGMRYLVRGI